jgi:ATP-binding cassette, subfamily B, bacterial PglK
MFLQDKIKKLKKIYYLAFDSQDKKRLSKLMYFMFAGTLLELFSVGLIFPAIKLLTDNEFLTKSYSLLNIEALDTKILLLTIVIIFITFFGFKNIFLWFVLKKYVVFLARYEAKLQTKLFRGYLGKSVSYFKEKNSSDIILSIKEISSFFSSVYLNALITLFLEITIQTLILVLLFYFSWQSILPVFTLFGFLSLIIFSFSKKKLEKLGKLRNEFSQKQLLNIQQGIGGIKEIKLLSKELFFLKKFINNTDVLVEANIKNAMISGVPRLLIEFFAVCSVGLIIFVFLSLGKSIAEILPTLGLFLVAAYKMVPSFNKILLMMNRIKFSTDMVNRIVNLSAEFKNEEVDFDKNVIVEKMNFKRQLELNDINFRYPTREEQILSDINLLIDKNSFIGISGESGSGKSTLIDIIMGITKPDNGEIKVDGKFINDSINKWQKNIGYVSQNIFIIPGTIKHNIAFGVDEDKIDEQLVHEVVKKTSLKFFIDSLELGIDTHVGEGGGLISGGQKQRIGIARALYNKPELLVFDEATSSLDLETEKEILNEIYALKKEFTLIFISHRESSIKYCDRKYLIKNQKLLEISSN